MTHSRELAAGWPTVVWRLHDGVSRHGSRAVIRYCSDRCGGNLRESRTLFLLAVVGVALGVASVVAIQTLNQGAMQAFDGSVRAVSGQADLTVAGHRPRPSPRPCWSRCWPTRGDGGLAACAGSTWPCAAAPGLLLDVVGVDSSAPVRYPLRRAAPDRGTP